MSLLFSKYGFLDLTFVAPLQLLERVGCPSRSVLHELSFVGTDEDRSCLETLIEGIDQSKCWLRLFLFGEPAMDAIKRLFEEYRKHPQPASHPASVESTTFRMERVVSRMADRVEQRLPMTFTVEDACLTNSDSIWLASHAYL